MNHTSLCTLLIAALLCSQVGLFTACGGCTARHDRDRVEGAGGPRIIHGMEVRPDETALSEPAEITAAYLTVMEALARDDEESALQAAEVLARGRGELALPVEHWLEFALWFVDRKSVNAIPFLRTACRARPESAGLLLLYSESLTDHNFTSEALAALDAWLAMHPGDVDVLVQKGVILQKDGRPAEAAAVYDAIPEKDRSAFLNLSHAQALMALGRDREAMLKAREAVKQNPDMGEALALQAFLSEKTGQLREARQAYEKLLQQRYASKDILIRLIVISLKLDQPAKALAYYRQGPDDDISFDLSVASLFTDFRHYLQAERILKTISSRPDAPLEVYLFLANLVFEQRRDLNAALAWLDRIPSDSGAAERRLLLKGQLQAEAGRIDDALSTARAGRSSSPAVADFCMLECRVLATAGRSDEALVCARDGAATWPDNMDMAFLLGSLLAEQGHGQEALSVMEGIVERDGDNYRALNYVGYTLANENRDLERALRLLNRANALAPEKFYILDSLAWAHYRLGNDSDAWNFIREAVRLDTSSDSEIWEHYGDIAVRRRLYDEARRAYTRALQNRAGKSGADALRRKLEELRQ